MILGTYVTDFTSSLQVKGICESVVKPHEHMIVTMRDSVSPFCIVCIALFVSYLVYFKIKDYINTACISQFTYYWKGGDH
jgi:hypothetical protein